MLDLENGGVEGPAAPSISCAAAISTCEAKCASLKACQGEFRKTKENDFLHNLTT